MQDNERRCGFSARPKALTGHGVQPRSVVPQGSGETGTNPSNRPLKAVAWVQTPSGLQTRIPCAARDSARCGGEIAQQGFHAWATPGPQHASASFRSLKPDSPLRNPTVDRMGVLRQGSLHRGSGPRREWTVGSGQPARLVAASACRLLSSNRDTSRRSREAVTAIHRSSATTNTRWAIPAKL